MTDQKKRIARQLKQRFLSSTLFVWLPAAKVKILPFLSFK